MPLHGFTLALASPRALTTDFEAAVFEAGCDDAALLQRGGTVYLEFDREAPSFLEAVLSAIGDVHAIPGAAVSRVEPDELVTASEIARRIGRTRESVRLLAEGARGPGGFPAAATGSRGQRTRLWRWSEVASWLQASGIPAPSPVDGRTVAAVNGALDPMRNTDDDSLRRILGALGKAS